MALISLVFFGRFCEEIIVLWQTTFGRKWRYKTRLDSGVTVIYVCRFKQNVLCTFCWTFMIHCEFLWGNIIEWVRYPYKLLQEQVWKDLLTWWWIFLLQCLHVCCICLDIKWEVVESQRQKLKARNPEGTSDSFQRRAQKAAVGCDRCD